MVAPEPWTLKPCAPGMLTPETTIFRTALIAPVAFVFGEDPDCV